MHSLRTYLLQALADPAARDAAGPEALVSAETYATRRYSSITAPSAVTPLDPELIEVGDAIGQRAQRRDPPIWRLLRRLRVAVDATPELGFCVQGRHVPRREIWRTGGAVTVRSAARSCRGCAAGMAEASKQFRRVNGHLHLPALRDALERHVADQAVGGDCNTHDVSTA
jgi:hypothetical protein